MAISGVAGVSELAGGMRAGGGVTQLSSEQQQEVNRLKAIDRKVRAHEQAHMAAGSGVTGGASFQFTRGPDGRQYAVGGEVTINVSSGQTPESTIERARIIQTAALAPADPSSQDRAVAAAAAMMESQARAELSRMKKEEQSTGSTSNPLAESLKQATALRAYAQSDTAETSSASLIDQYA
ncbi:MAG: putative metalloprotease CJM1_0395 family protein [Pseudomonadota bacterium]|nr:putative metalloprotease CJM1_0395 family protein [Pseudomonadota bacterium]MDP1903976.1 putative metalloprotease CJM1_0395 family protein [Pseudomonadota bacterium]MDP2354070.1 putative metalloprotease CJM1_0395 family protein [Pseudomonadota bacterium]